VSGLIAIWAALEGAVLAAFSPTSPYGAPALGGALLFAGLFYAGRRRSHGRRPSVKGFVRSIFPRWILLHPSSLVDLRLWTLNGIVFAYAYASLGLGLFFWRDAVVSGMRLGFGAHEPALWPVGIVLAMATVLQVLAYELAYWFAHYLFHRIPALWEFHKVHHSAEVMTTRIPWKSSRS
jgi:sterol desaturase/sphingolipid hydroxylase (fatty acid hydroxylase superfamily)